MERIGLALDGPPEPDIDHEDEVSERFDDRPLVVDALVALRFGEPASASKVASSCPKTMSYAFLIPSARRREELFALGVATLELGVDQGPNLDAIDLEPEDLPSKLAFSIDAPTIFAFEKSTLRSFLFEKSPPVAKRHRTSSAPSRASVGVAPPKDSSTHFDHSV